MSYPTFGSANLRTSKKVIDKKQRFYGDFSDFEVDFFFILEQEVLDRRTNSITTIWKAESPPFKASSGRQKLHFPVEAGAVLSCVGGTLGRLGAPRTCRFDR